MAITHADGWAGLDLRHLAALEAVAHAGSFAKAAAGLGYTQPAISQQIAALERIVGQRLFERQSGPKPVTLTEAGELLLRHAEAIQARLSAAQADMDALAAGTAGTLRVGTFQSVAARILPELVVRFRAEWPDVEVQLTELDDDEDLLDLVERGELDLTFVMLPYREGPFEVAEALLDPYVVLARPGSGIESIEDLNGKPLIAFRNCRSSALCEGALRARGIEPNVVFRSDDNGTVQGFVATGLGVAVMPRLSVGLDDPRTEVIPLDDLPPRRIGVAWHRDRYRSPAFDAFVQLALVSDGAAAVSIA